MDGPPRIVLDPIGFEWDDANRDKSWQRHGVSWHECEELFSQRPFLVSDDLAHSDAEPRYLALGRTRTGRRLFVSFTIRDDKVRVISARDMSRRERRSYEQARQAQVAGDTETDPGVS